MKLSCLPLLLTLTLWLPFTAQAGTEPAEVEAALAAALKTEQEASAEAEAWAGEREVLRQKIGQAKTQLKWLDSQNRRYEDYIKRQKEAVEELERRKRELARIKIELEPYLDEVVDRLAAFIQSDLDFLPQERAGRLAFLRRSLSDYNLPASEKLRRVMEALIVEAGYGSSVEKTEAEIEIDGQRVWVDQLRVGRLALYYQTPDGRRLGWRPAGAAGWSELPAALGRELSRALEMAQRRRAVELVNLPLGEPAR